jgi:uncharacterized repeat protein (TIGR01451 family)
VDANSTLTIAPVPGVTSLTMVSQPGDYIGGGRTYALPSSTGAFSAYTSANDNHVGFHYTDPANPGGFWDLDFAAPLNSPLVAGNYANATRYPFEASNVPGLNVDGEGRGSNTLTGSFTVTQAIYGVGGTLHRFDATFVQHSEGAAPALTGEMKYNQSTAPSGVLINDQAAVGDVLTAILVTGPAHGTLVFNSDGTFAYTPSANFQGADTFTYMASDGTTNSNVATVTIMVNPAQPPVAANDSYTGTENSALNVAAPGVLANDTDVDGHTLTPVLVQGPAHGTLTLSLDGSFAYTPSTGYYGSDSFTYQASDGHLLSNTATVNLTIKGFPVAQNDIYTVQTGIVLTVPGPGVLGNDSDPNGASLSAHLVSGPLHGTLSFGTDGSFSYVPSPGYTGNDSFTYQATDGTLASNFATVTLVNANYQPQPPVAGNDSYNMDANSTLTIAAVPGVTSLTMVSQPGDYIGQGGTYSYTSATGNFSGSTSTPNNTVAFSYQDKQNSGAWWYLNFAAPFNAPLIPGSYNNATRAAFHAFNVPGLDVFGEGRGSNTLTGSFNVTQATYGADGTLHRFDATFVQHSEGAAPALTGEIKYNQSTAPSGVLINDQAAVGDVLTAILVTGPAHGTLVFSNDGTFTYTPSAGFVGDDTFTYKANNGISDSNVATVTIHVKPAIPPVANNDTYSLQAGVALTVPAPGVLGNDSDSNGFPLSANLVTGPLHGSLTFAGNGSFTYTPNAGYTGNDRFTYQANDGTLGSNIATVNLVSANHQPPVAVNDAYRMDPNTTLTIPSVPGVTSLTMVSQPGDYIGQGRTYALPGPTGSFSVNNSANDNHVAFHYSDSANPGGFWDLDFAAPFNAPLIPGVYNNATRYPFEASNVPGLNVDGEGRGSNTLTGSFIVLQSSYGTGGQVLSFDATFVQHSEGATPALTGEMKYNQPGGPAGVLLNDQETDGDLLSAALVSGPSHGFLSLNSDGSFAYTPVANFTGTDTFTYKANDGTTDSNIATVTITVDHVPVAVNDSYLTPQNTPLNVAAPGVLGNDTDSDSHTLTALLAQGPTHGSLTLNPDGSFFYTPSFGYHGSDSFTYQATDGLTTSNTATVNLTVNPAPDLSVALTHAGNFRQGDIGDTYTITVTNVGSVATSGQVSLSDALPAGLTATGLTGNGWQVDLGTLTATRTDSLAPGNSFPLLTLTVNVLPTAPASVSNAATVAGGGEGNLTNDTATDPTTVIQAADLTLTAGHLGNFRQGDIGDTYTLIVTNVGPGPTVGTVSLADVLPAGLTATDISGTGWTTDLSTLTAFRSDPLGPGASYPPLTVTVNVAANAPPLVTNMATVAGGGELNTTNDSASDPTTIIQVADLVITKTHVGNFTQDDPADSYTLTVSNIGPGPTVGTVSIADVLPAGLTATALTGAGWTTNLASLTATRSDPLPPGNSYPALTLTVSVADLAPAGLSNSATVAGGGELNTTNDTATDPTTIVQLPPILGGSNNLSTISMDQTSNDGDLVSSLVSGQMTLLHHTAIAGIAVTGLNGPYGTWQFSVDGGFHWTAFGAVSDSSATLLGTWVNDRVRFMPDGVHGTSSASLTFRAWDQTDGHHSGDTGANVFAAGGPGAYSAATAISSIFVMAPGFPAQPTVVNGNLLVAGTNNSDDINVAVKGLHSADAREARGGARTSAAIYLVTLNGDRSSIPAGQVSGHVIIYTFGGSDYVVVVGPVSAEIHAGNGDDTITGGSGDDVIWGGGGADIIQGGGGNDVLIGGTGDSRVSAGRGNSLLVGGTFQTGPVHFNSATGGYEAYDYATLHAIAEAWALGQADPDLATNLAHSLVHGLPNRLTGGRGRNWFLGEFAGIGADLITNLKASDKETSL